MKKTLLPLLFALLLTLAACGAPTESAATAAPATPESMTEPEAAEPAAKAGTLASFAAVDLDGNAVDESIFADYELTMINIWATFCGPCLREMPELGELAQTYEPRGVRVVGIVADVRQSADGGFDEKMTQTARELVAETGADYLHLLPSDDLVSAKLSAVSAVPETIFVNSAGEVVGKSYIGSRSGEDWAAIVDALLEELA